MTAVLFKKGLVFSVIVLFIVAGVVPSISSDKSYVPGENKDFYDMVIITCEQFVDELQTLAVHKNSIGITTFIKTTEEIYSEYSGVDGPEQIKYFIKDALETYGINYVLLVGNSSLLPVRYSHLDDGVETSFPSDFYYADVYTGSGAFENWDSNGNGIFAEWNITSKDILDLYPDVYVGRLPCSNTSEVETSVSKIITYEKIEAGSWFNTVLLCGGDTCISMDDYNEGELINSEIESILGNITFSFEKLWASNDTLSVSNITNEINNGVGFIDFSGIGEHDTWMTHSHNDSESVLPIGGYTKNDVLNLSNGNMLPVIMIGGGYCADIDSPDSTISDAFLFHSDGGGIGVFGSTALVYCICGDDCCDGLFGYLETQLFKNYNNEGVDILGELWCSTVTDYRNNFPVMSDSSDCKTVEEFILIGDPSLKIGGYALDYPVHNIDSGEDFDFIQDAVDDSDTQNGDTILVDAGVYYENVIVNKTIDLIGEDRNNTIVDGTGFGDVIFIIANHVNISGFTIRNSGDLWEPNNEDAGIDIRSNSTSITNCNISYNDQGIFYYNSHHNSISNNVIFGNENGISSFDDFSNNITIFNNIITLNGGGGIYFEGENININNNQITFQGGPAIGISNSAGNSISNNIITNNGEGEGITFNNCIDTSINENEISFVNNGLYLAHTSNITLFDNNVSNSSCGIFLFNASSNNIFNNTLSNNGDGIRLFISCNNNQIVNNTIVSSIGDGIIIAESSCFNYISDNNITNNLFHGIVLSTSENNTIFSNNITANNDGGISSSSSSFNNINNNEITFNGNYGIYFYNSYNNTVYDNFFSNINNAYDYGDNIWNISKTPGINIVGGQYLGGNYWSDYNGTDNDGDGLGDTNIPYGPGDYLPLTAFMDINQSTFNRGFPIRHAIDGDWAGAQNFTPTLNTLTSVDIYLRKFGAPEFDLTVELREDYPQGTLLDTVLFTPSEVASSWQWLNVDFDDVNVGAGSDVFIVLPPAPSGVTTSFGYEWGYAFGNQYDDGAFWFTRDGGGLWRDLPTMYEFVFRTYGHN